MKRILITTASLSAAVIAVTLVGAAPQAEATAPSAPWATNGVFQATSPAYQVLGRQEFAAGANVSVLQADTTRGIDTREALPNKQQAQFTLTPVQGVALTTGVYHLVGNATFPVTPEPVLQIDGTYMTGELDILDLASNPANGQITRFDAVMEGVGEFRFGEDAKGATLFGSHAITFSETYVGKPATMTTETLQNTSTTAVSLGKPTITGQNPTSFSTSAGSCGTSLAAGAVCTFQVGFAPTAGGPASATLGMAVAGVTKTVTLAGSAYLGTTTLTSKGSDPVDKGVSTVTTGANSNMYVTRSGGGWIFGSTTLVGGNSIVQDYVQGPGDGPLPTGSRATYIGGEGTGYSITATVNSLGCDTTGSWNVSRFDLDPVTDIPTTVDMTFSQTCNDSPGVQTGVLQWQARSDVTPPTAVSNEKISSTSPRAATWTKSPSTDVETVIARLVQGDGAGATPISGIPLTVTGGTSAAIPTVATGQQYTVVVFAVDATGNVSAATRAGFGTPAVVVSAPGAPTMTKVVAGNGEVTVYFTPPANTGGLPITGYEVDAFTGLHKAVGASSPLTVTGLKNGYPAQFRVTAINAAGSGQISYLSASVTPHK